MGPVSGGVGNLGDGVPEEIAGDKIFFTPAVITAKFLKKPIFAILGTPNGVVTFSVWTSNLEPSTQWQSHKRPEVDI